MITLPRSCCACGVKSCIQAVVWEGGGGRGKKIVGELKLCVCVWEGAIFKLHSFLGRNR